MKAEQKAHELIYRFMNNLSQGLMMKDAKICALICVDEIIEATKIKTYNWISNTLEIGFKYSKYWQEVKQAIKKL